MHKEQIEATHTHNDFTQLRAAWMRKTLLLHVWLIGVLALERKKLQRDGAGRRRGSTRRPAGSPSWLSGPPPCAWASFYMPRGFPQVVAQVRVKMARNCANSGCTVLSNLTLMAGDKGIKCPSGSLEQCRGGPLGAPPLATGATLPTSHVTARLRLRGAPPRASGEAPE